jgi:hypothetical protein
MNCPSGHHENLPSLKLCGEFGVTRNPNAAPPPSPDSYTPKHLMDVARATVMPLRTRASGLTYTFGDLASAGDDLEFSNNVGATWTFNPTAGANGCDPAVTHVRVNPKGIFARGLAGAGPSFQLKLRVCVK